LQESFTGHKLYTDKLQSHVVLRRLYTNIANYGAFGHLLASDLVISMFWIAPLNVFLNLGSIKSLLRQNYIGPLTLTWQ